MFSVPHARTKPERFFSENKECSYKLVVIYTIYIHKIYYTYLQAEDYKMKGRTLIIMVIYSIALS